MAGWNVPRRLGLAVAAVLAVVAVVLLGVSFLLPGEAVVSGTATWNDQPLAEALVVFVPDEERQSPIAVPTDDAGRYQLIGGKGGGVPPGKYRVVVTKMALKDGRVPKGELLEQARAKGQLVNVLPRAYEEFDTTPFRWTLRSGLNTINLEVKGSR